MRTATEDGSGNWTYAATLASGSHSITATATDQAGNQTSTTIRQYYDNTPRQRLVAVSGDRQHGLIGTMLAQPLVVRFEQPGGQPIAGAALTFTVIGNNATLSAGTASGRSLKVVTDALGQATVRWTLGTHAGAASHRVEVRADGIWEPLQLTASLKDHSTGRYSIAEFSVSDAADPIMLATSHKGDVPLFVEHCEAAVAEVDVTRR